MEVPAGLGTAGEPAGLAMGTPVTEKPVLHAAMVWGQLAGMPLPGDAWAALGNGDGRGGNEGPRRSISKIDSHLPFPGVVSACGGHVHVTFPGITGLPLLLSPACTLLSILRSSAPARDGDRVQSSPFPTPGREGQLPLLLYPGAGR